MAPDAPRALVRKVFALYNEGGVGGKDSRLERLAVTSFLVMRHVNSTDDLDAADLAFVAHALEYWKLRGEIESRCRRIADITLSVTTKQEAGQR